MTGVSIPKRSGWVTFAALIMYLVGGLLLLLSLVELFNSAWLKDISTGLFGQHFTTWGFVDLGLAIIAFVAGYSILYGGKLGYWIGIFAAIFSAIRWFFYIPFVPFAAILVIALDVLIIYGLSSNKDYFD